jgi:hypothetical protein
MLVLVDVLDESPSRRRRRRSRLPCRHAGRSGESARRYSGTTVRACAWRGCRSGIRCCRRSSSSGRKCTSVPRFSVSPVTCIGEYVIPSMVFELTVLRHATMKLHEVLLAVAAHGQAQPFDSRSRTTRPRRANRPTPCSCSGRTCRRRAARSSRFRRRCASDRACRRASGRSAHAAAVVGHGDRVVGVDGDVDVVAMPASASSMELSSTSKTRWCRPVPSDVSPMYIPGALADRLQTLEDLNRGCAVAVVGLRNWVFSHGFFSGSASLLGHCGVDARSLHETFRNTLKMPKGQCAPWKVFSFGRVRCASASPHI